MQQTVGRPRWALDPILDVGRDVYVDRLDEDGAFLSSVIPYSKVQWEKPSIFLDLLTPKLPAPKEEDLAKAILEAIDRDSYRVEKKATMA